MGLDHIWLTTHPGKTNPFKPFNFKKDYFIQGTEEQARNNPQNYFFVGGKYFAHGRDPYFDGWTDTLQLNYRNPGLRKAMIQELLRIATCADGVRFCLDKKKKKSVQFCDK